MSRVSALAPFRVRSFRFQWPADLATSWAFEMETLILGWYVLVETQSVVMLGIFGSLQYLGSLLAPFTGVIGDRLGSRTMLLAIRVSCACLPRLRPSSRARMPRRPGRNRLAPRRRSLPPPPIASSGRRQAAGTPRRAA